MKKLILLLFSSICLFAGLQPAKKFIRRFETDDTKIKFVRFDNGGSEEFVTAGEKLILWNAKTGKSSRVFSGYEGEGEPTALTVTSLFRCIAVGFKSGKVKVWNKESINPYFESDWSLDRGPVTSIADSTLGGILFISFKNKKSLAYDFENIKRIDDFDKQLNPEIGMNASCFSSLWKWIFIFSDQFGKLYNLYLEEIEDFKKIIHSPSTPTPINIIFRNPMNSMNSEFAVGSSNGFVSVWTNEPGEHTIVTYGPREHSKISSFRESHAPVVDLCFYGSQVGFVNADGLVCIFNKWTSKSIFKEKVDPDGNRSNEFKTRSISFSGDGKTFVTGGAGKNNLFLWNSPVLEDKQLASSSIKQYESFPVADKCEGFDGYLLKYNTENFDERGKEKSKVDPILESCFAFNPKIWNQIIFSRGNELFLGNLKTRKAKRIGKTGKMIRALSYNCSGDKVLISIEGGSIAFINLNARKPTLMTKFLRTYYKPKEISFRRDDEMLILGYDDELNFIKFEIEKDEIKIIESKKIEHEEHIEWDCAKLNSDGGRIIACSEDDNNFFEFDLTEGDITGRFIGKGVGVNCLIPNPINNKQFLVGSGDLTGENRMLEFWSTTRKQKVFRSFVGHKAPVLCGAFSPDGRLLITGDSNGVINFWNPILGKKVKKSEFIDYKGVQGIKFSCDGRYFITLSGDHNLCIWKTPYYRKVIRRDILDDKLKTIPQESMPIKSKETGGTVFEKGVLF